MRTDIEKVPRAVAAPSQGPAGTCWPRLKLEGAQHMGSDRESRAFSTLLHMFYIRSF